MRLRFTIGKALKYIDSNGVGVILESRIFLEITLNPYNINYLKTKKKWGILFRQQKWKSHQKNPILSNRN